MLLCKQAAGLMILQHCTWILVLLLMITTVMSTRDEHHTSCCPEETPSISENWQLCPFHLMRWLFYMTVSNSVNNQLDQQMSPTDFWLVCDDSGGFHKSLNTLLREKIMFLLLRSHYDLLIQFSLTQIWQFVNPVVLQCPSILSYIHWVVFEWKYQCASIV